MELGTLYKGFISLLDWSDDIPLSVMNAMLSDGKDDLLSYYCDLVSENLRTDELQKIFQYYYADRKEKMQDYTPESIGKLCAMATKTSGMVVYDLCAGSGSLTIQKWVQTPEKTFICEGRKRGRIHDFDQYVFRACLRERKLLG